MKAHKLNNFKLLYVGSISDLLLGMYETHAHCPSIGTRVRVDFKIIPKQKTRGTFPKTSLKIAKTVRDLFGTLMLKVRRVIRKTHTEYR